MTLHLKSRGYPFRPRLLFSSFIVVGVGFPTVYYFRRGQTGVCRGGGGSQDIGKGKKKEEAAVSSQQPPAMMSCRVASHTAVVVLC